MTKIMRMLFVIFFGATVVMPAFAAEPYDEGVKLFQKKSYDLSAKQFEKVLETSPHNEKALYYAGLSYQYLGDNKRALEYYKSLIATYPNSSTSKYLKSSLKMTSATTSLPVLSPSINKTGANDYIPDSDAVPYTRNSHRDIVVVCQLNKSSLPMIFDTGAEESLVGKNHLQSLGIALPAGKPTGASLGFGGTVASWNIPVEVQLGKIRKTLNLGVHEKSDFALLGQDFFGDMKYNIDHHASIIRFHKVGARGGYVPVDTIQIPFTREGKEILVDATMGGFPTQLYFDTGATTTVMGPDMHFWAKMRGWKVRGTGKITGVGGSQKVTWYEVPEVKLGGILQENFKVIMLSEQHLSRGVLGQDFYGGRQYVIDEEKKVIHFYRR